MRGLDIIFYTFFNEAVIESREKTKKHSPSTKDVKSVTLAAFLLPAGRFKPIFSSFSLSRRPPFLDFALRKTKCFHIIKYVHTIMCNG